METKKQLELMELEELDKIVHNMKSEEATDINNRGREEQIKYILNQKIKWANSSQNRPQWTDSNIEETFKLIKIMTDYRREQKGNGIYVSSHECLGVITEEYKELIDAVQSNNTEALHKELLDIAVACVFSLASIDTKKMHWC